MMQNCVRWCIAIAAAAAVAAGQQPNRPLTFEEIWKLAQARYSLAERARLDERSANEQVRQARAGFLPQLAYNNAFTYNSPRRDDPSTFAFVSLNGIREYVSQAAVTQELDTSGRLRAALERGRAERAGAQARAAITIRDLRLALQEVFYGLLEARHNVEAAQQNVNQAEDFLRRTRLMAEQGEAARSDVVKADVQLAGRRRDLYAAQAEALNGGIRLKSFWSDDLAQPPEIEDNFLRVPTEQDYLGWDAAWVGRRSEFSLLDAVERIARADARAARSERRPTLTVDYAYGIDANQVRIRERGQELFANLRIPLFDWHRSKSREQQANFVRQQVEIDRQISRRIFTSAFYIERNNTELAVKQMAEGKRETEQARESLRLARLRYDGGETTALEVVDAQNTLAAAQVAYHRAVFDYHLARARLEVATGQ